jgi:hypothetical protein
MEERGEKARLEVKGRGGSCGKPDAIMVNVLRPANLQLSTRAICTYTGVSESIGDFYNLVTWTNCEGGCYLVANSRIVV